MLKKILILILINLFFSKKTYAFENKLGAHILYADEIERVNDLLPNGGYVTVPMAIDDLDQNKWQKFFNIAGDRSLIPIIRLTTKFENNNWRQPTKKDILDFSKFLNSLDWKRDSLIIVLFNEPNQAGEWGGEISPEKYGDMLSFALDWFKTEKRNFTVLPAALDMAADGKRGTMAANKFLNILLAKYPDTIINLDAWNSHAYPNPGFIGRPLASNFASVKSYQWELNLLKNKLGKEFTVYITETGWDSSRLFDSLIAIYFRIAYEKIWREDDQVVAVTPFLFNAQTLPFSNFSLIDRNDKPTPLYEMIRELNQESK